MDEGRNRELPLSKVQVKASGAIIKMSFFNVCSIPYHYIAVHSSEAVKVIVKIADIGFYDLIVKEKGHMIFNARATPQSQTGSSMIQNTILSIIPIVCVLSNIYYVHYTVWDESMEDTKNVCLSPLP